MMKKIAYIVGGLTVAMMIGVAALLWYYRGYDPDVLEAEYATSPSRFVDIGDVRYHVRQEGQGPDVVLLHGTFASLFMWDEWVADLSDRYRFTRVDLIGAGLTGPGGHDYVAGESVDSLVALFDALGLDDFDLVGTSFAGVLSFRMAGDFPERVKSLALINSAGLLHQKTNPNVSQTIPIRSNVLSHITPKSMVDDFITGLIRVKEKATPEVLQQYYDLIMRRGNRQSLLQGFYNYTATDPNPWLNKITEPVLIIWSDGSVLPVEESKEFMQQLHNAAFVDKEVIVGGGHALPISHSQETGLLASNFWQKVERLGQDVNVLDAVEAE